MIVFSWRDRHTLGISIWFADLLELFLVVVRDLLYGLTIRLMIDLAGIIATHLLPGLHLLVFTLWADGVLIIGVIWLTQWLQYILRRNYAREICLRRMILLGTP